MNSSRKPRKLVCKTGVSVMLAPVPYRGKSKLIFDIVNQLSGDHNEFVPIRKVWQALPQHDGGSQAKTLTLKEFDTAVDSLLYRCYLQSRDKRARGARVASMDDRRQLRIDTLANYNRRVQAVTSITNATVNPDGTLNRLTEDTLEYQREKRQARKPAKAKPKKTGVTRKAPPRAKIPAPNEWSVVNPTPPAPAPVVNVVIDEKSLNQQATVSTTRAFVAGFVGCAVALMAALTLVVVLATFFSAQ